MKLEKHAGVVRGSQQLMLFFFLYALPHCIYCIEDYRCEAEFVFFMLLFEA